jgi:acyl-CoA synthetase (AMP-forming)/AMP-acid ligase II
MATYQHATIVEALAAAASDRPFVTMWEDDDAVESMTFGEFRRFAHQQAQHLRREGLRDGDTIVIVMPQGIPLMATFAGAMLAGAVPTILAYPTFKTDPVKYSAGLSGVLANLNAPMVAVQGSDTARLLIDHWNADRPLRIVVCAARAHEWPDFRCSAIDPDRVAFIQHSAGTTGLQKGVALTHAAVLRQLDHLQHALRITEDDRIYSWLPLYHDMGLIACFMLPLVAHVPVVMQAPTTWVAQPASMPQLIAEHRCTLAWVPNFALQFLARRVRAADRDTYDLSSLRALINCSEPIRAESIDEIERSYASSGLARGVVKTSFAMAENVFAVTQSPIDDVPRRIHVDRVQFAQERLATPIAADDPESLCLVSSGRCLEGQEVRIVDSSGTTIPDGRIGEIRIRTDCQFNGYYNRPDLTARALSDGWYRTGDLGFLLDGELYVIGRSTDLIIVAGKNIYPQDIEEIVCQHRAIHDGRAVAFGLHNPELGTEDIIVAAEVEQESDLADALQIERALRDAVVATLDVAVRAVYLKPPRWIVKSTAGKAARSTTRAKLLAEHAELARSQPQP